MASPDRLAVLTYHSISDAGGPTSIAPGEFAAQMAALAEAGYASCTLADYRGWHEGTVDGPARRVLITFDDAFCDFADAAAPILARHGFRAIVFVPTAQVGSPEGWVGANAPPRPLMDWDAIRALAADGFEFGAHSRTHANLPQLDPQARESEIAGSARDLKDRIATPARAFAAPYGAVDNATIAAIGRYFPIAFGTRLAVSRRGTDRLDVPRIDMHYFRSPARWRRFLEGDRGYFTARRALRAVRHAALAVAG